jgi:hypothetical protein
LTEKVGLIVVIQVRFEDLTEVAMRSTIFWIVTSCISEEVYIHFGGNIASIFRVEGKSRQETSKKQAPTLLLDGFFFN